MSKLKLYCHCFNCVYWWVFFFYFYKKYIYVYVFIGLYKGRRKHGGVISGYLEIYLKSSRTFKIIDSY